VKPFERRVFQFRLKIHRPLADGHACPALCHAVASAEAGSSDQDQNKEGRVPPIIRGALGTNITLHENVIFLFFTNKYFKCVKLRGRGVKYN
jgi:hypothetical protein